MIKYSVENKYTILQEKEDADIICYLIGEDEADAEKIFKAVNCERLKLVIVYVSDWNLRLSPWKADKVFRNGGDFGGEAEDFLHYIEMELIPEVENNGKYSRIIAGYSLAGLFAVWSCFNSPLFDRLVSCSGSMWFDGFTEYAESHELRSKLKSVYFSLGDKEKKTRNPRMAPVEEDTEKICSIVSHSAADTVFRLVPGNHFNEPEKRLADGIAYVIRSLRN